MKYRIQIIVGIFALIIFSQCKSSKMKLENEQPFKIVSATYSDWVGGVKGVRGTTIEILVANQNIKIDTLYFRRNVVVPELIKLENNKLQIVGNIINKTRDDFILHKNSQQEYGNKPPMISKTNFPFELTSEELVIGYFKNKKYNYFKIKLKKQKTQLYK